MPNFLPCRFCPGRKREASTSNHLLQQLETGDIIRNDFFNGQLASYGQMREGAAGTSKAVKHATGCSGNVCHAAMMEKFNGPRMSDTIDSDKSAVWEEARGFLSQYYAEFSSGDDKSRATGASSRAPSRVSGKSRNRRPTGTLEARLQQVKREIARTGTYVQTFAELEFGAQLAWRNEGRCINRKVWDTLRLLDRREEEEPKKLFEFMLEHIDSVWTDGTLVVKISVFKPKMPGQRGCEFVSTQLHRFAAYPVEGGSCIGDPANRGLTELCVQCGWKPPPPSARTQWDLLPVLIQDSGGAVHMFELPERLKSEPFVVHLTHPDARVAEAIEVLGLRWCAIPIINNFCLWAGGIAYQCAPFSGWFMETEIARDLADVQRYNMLPRLMDELNLPESVHALALDDAWLSLNQSVLYSFQQKRITIVDHQSTSRGFCSWFAETSKNTIVPGDWVWIVPPLGGSTCPVFHQEMLNFRLSPAYILNEDRVVECLRQQPGSGLGVPLSQAQAALRGVNLVEHQRKIPHIQVLFGSQTGTVERLASEYVRKMTRLGAKCSCLSLDAWLDDTEVVADVLADLAQPLSFPLPMEGNEDNAGTEDDRIFAVQALYSKLQEAAALKTLIVVMCSTTGTGHMPSNASGFAQACEDLRHLAKGSSGLQQKVSELRAMGHSYAVCGFGSTSYLKFNKAARDVQASLQDLLGSPAVALGLCDAAGEQRKTWAAWQKTLADAAFPSASDRSGPRACPIPSTLVEWRGPNDQGHEVTLQVPTSPTCSPMSPASHGTAGSAAMSVARTRTQMSSETGHIRPSEQHHSPDDVGALVTATRELLRGSEIARMVELTFVLSGSRQYTPGDVLEVAPACTADVASRFIAALGLQDKKDHNLVCRPRTSDPEEANSVPWRFAKDVTLWNVVRYELDIGCAPPQGLLVYIAWATGSEQLRQLAEDESAYSTWVEQGKPSLLDLIQEHSITCTPGAPRFVPLEAFLEELPRPKRRLYSISCTMPPRSNKTKLTVTCSLHRFGPSDRRLGLCSSYLHSLRPGDKVRARIRHGERLDLEGATRVLLIGAGSGVSPLRAHWQKLVNSVGQCQVVLYQGCQTSAEQAYAEEVKRLVAEGKMEAHVAFSKVEPRQYVQDVLRRTKDLWRVLQDPGTRVYVSGATRVARAVRHAFESAGEAAGVSLEDARQFLLRLAKERRYVEDAFGGE